jgi:glycosyltransferase involved in cell wall biosynthesis
MKVSICALTYCRPEGLLRLLEGLNALELVALRPDIEVIIVDNDPERSAEDVCSRVRAGFRWNLRYEVESRRGVVHARNTAVDLVSPDSDWVAFIDDDEVPAESWLSELLKVQSETGADAVAGRVVPHFADPVEPWIEAGGFFQQQRFPDGSALPHAFTNNVLFRAAILTDQRFQPPFAERYALMGGEDRHFFQRVRMAGYRLCWADEAVVTEWIPASRANARWLVQRQFRVGTALAFIESELDPGLRRRLRRWGRACRGMALGIGSLPWARVRGRVAYVHACQRIASNLGALWGMFGRTYREYRQIHGS